jgi:hypothetical protein
MSTKLHKLLSMLVICLGIVLMVGGIITEKHGATVGGMIVAAVATQQWLRTKKVPYQIRQNNPK